MPLYSDLGIYCAPHLATSSYYSSPFLGTSSRSPGLGLGLMPLPRLLSSSRVSPLLPMIPESKAGSWRGPILDRIPSPRVSAVPRYLPPKPVRIDTCDIDVSSARYAARRERELASVAVAAPLDRRGTIQRGRTVVRLHTKRLKENPALEQRRRMTPGEKLVQKFLIRDKAEEAAKEAHRRRIEEREEAERVETEIGKLQALAVKTAAANEASGTSAPAAPDASVQHNFPKLHGLSENAALDILLSAQEVEQRLEDDEEIVRDEGTVKRRRREVKDETVKAAAPGKRVRKRRKEEGEEESEPSSELPYGADDEPIEKSTLQRRNTVRFRRGSHDVDAESVPSSRRSSFDHSPEVVPESRRSSVDSADDVPLAQEKKATVKRKKGPKHKIVADVSVENAESEPRSPRFVVDEVKVEESPSASPRAAAGKKFRYEVIVEDVDAETGAGRRSRDGKTAVAAAPKKKKAGAAAGKAKPTPKTTDPPKSVESKSEPKKPTDLPQPKTADIPQPKTADLPQPKTADLPQPKTTDLPQPKTADLPQPKTPDLPQPKTADLPQPKTADIPQPKTADIPQPKTADLPQPKIADLPQPKTADLSPPKSAELPQPKPAVLPQPKPVQGKAQPAEAVHKSFQNLKSSTEPVEKKVVAKTDAAVKALPEKQAVPQPERKCDVKDKQKIDETREKLPEEKPKEETDEKARLALAAEKRKKMLEEIEATKIKINDLQMGLFAAEKAKPAVQTAPVSKVEEAKVGKRVVEKAKPVKRQADPSPPFTPTPNGEDSGINFWAFLDGVKEEEYVPYVARKPSLPKMETEIKAKTIEEPKKKGAKTKPSPLKIQEIATEKLTGSLETLQTAKRIAKLKNKDTELETPSPKLGVPPVPKVPEEKPLPKWKMQQKQKEASEEAKKVLQSKEVTPPKTPVPEVKAPPPESKDKSLEGAEAKVVAKVEKVADVQVKSEPQVGGEVASKTDILTTGEKDKNISLVSLQTEVPSLKPSEAPSKTQQKEATPPKTAMPEKKKLERPKVLELQKPDEKSDEKVVPKWKVPVKKETPTEVPESPTLKELPQKPEVSEEPKPSVEEERKSTPGEPKIIVEESKLSAEGAKQESPIQPDKLAEISEEKSLTKVKGFGKPSDVIKKPKEVSPAPPSPSKEPSPTPKTPQLKTEPIPEQKAVPKWKVKQAEEMKKAEQKVALPKLPLSPKDRAPSPSIASPVQEDFAGRKVDEKKSEAKDIASVHIPPKEGEKLAVKIDESKLKETVAADTAAADTAAADTAAADTSAQQKADESKVVPKWKVKSAQEKDAVPKKVPLGKAKLASGEKTPSLPLKTKAEVEAKAVTKPTEDKVGAEEPKVVTPKKDAVKDVVQKKPPLGKAKQGDKTLPASKAEIPAEPTKTAIVAKEAIVETKTETSEKTAKLEEKEAVEEKKPAKAAKTSADAEKKTAPKKPPIAKAKAVPKASEIAPEAEKAKPVAEKKTQEEEKVQKKPEAVGKAKGKAKTAEVKGDVKAKPAEEKESKKIEEVKDAEKVKPKGVQAKDAAKVKSKAAEVKDAKPTENKDMKKVKPKSTEAKDAVKGKVKTEETKDAEKGKPKPKEAKDADKGKAKPAEAKDADKGKVAEVKIEIKDAGKAKPVKARLLKKKVEEPPPPPPPPPPAESSSEEESGSGEDEEGSPTPRASSTSCSSSDSGFDSRPSSVPGSPASNKKVPSTASSGDSGGSPAPPLARSPSLDPWSEDAGLPPRSASGRHTPPATSLPRFRKYTVDDFQFLKVLGKGSFGKVLLAELRGTERYYAVKCLKKDVVLEDDDVECTLIERKVLALGTKHPYLCHLFCTFQTESHLLFVMEYLNGGDLMFHIQQSGRFPEPRARFYGAEIVCGLKFLHRKGIVYRDLKLDNILLDYAGHVRIADFGMCKLQIFLDRTADTFCGTPDYMAPEIIKGLKYNQCVDWWSFGVLLFEMLVGVSPFSGCDEDELFWSICNEQPQFPRFLSREAHSILGQLLEKDALKRLSTPEGTAGDVCNTAFFRSIDWDALERRELEPPFRPRVKHALDTQYFDAAFTQERAHLTPIELSILQSMDQAQFQGFSYTNPNATD